MNWVASARPDGGVDLDIPVAMPAADLLARRQAEGRAAALVSELPTRRYREAWALAGAALGVDMARARALHMARLRAARDAHPDWRLIDAARARQQDGGAVMSQTLKDRAQGLRDLPQVYQPLVDAAVDAEALWALWPGDFAR